MYKPEDHEDPPPTPNSKFVKAPVARARAITKITEPGPSNRSPPQNHEDTQRLGSKHFQCMVYCHALPSIRAYQSSFWQRIDGAMIGFLTIQLLVFPDEICTNYVVLCNAVYIFTRKSSGIKNVFLLEV